MYRTTRLLLLLTVLFPSTPAAQPTAGIGIDSPEPSLTTLVGTLDQLGPRVATLKRDLDADPGRSDVRVALGIELESIGDLGSAVEHYREALRLQPDHAMAFYHLSRTRRLLWEAEPAPSVVHNPSPASLVSIPSETDPSNTPPAEDVTGPTIRHLRIILDRDPKNPMAHLRLGAALLNRGEVDGAVRAYRTALSLEQDLAEARLGLARAFMLRDDWLRARDQLQKAIRLRGTLSEAHDALGTVYYTLGDVGNAMVAYRRAVSLDPGFADASYRLGLMLNVSNRPEEAVRAFRAAAQAGVPQAQYFLGHAYLTGSGVSRDPVAAIRWWYRAGDRGMRPARNGLAQLRREAVGSGLMPDRATADLRHAFQEYRASLWRDYPNVVPNGPRESLGARLLREGKTQEALPILIREASALSGQAQLLLETLYEVGSEERLPPFDDRIRRYFEEAAREGRVRPRLALARIHGLGLGVEQNLGKAQSLLGGLDDQEARLVQTASRAFTAVKTRRSMIEIEEARGE